MASPVNALDRWILPKTREVETSRWHRHVVQRRISRVDHLRPHRLNWDALKQPPVPEPYAPAEDPLTPRKVVGVRYFWLDGLFTTMSENFHLGFIPLYALAYGASTIEIGGLTATANLLGAVSLLPGARLAQAGRKRKLFVVWTVGGVARLSLLALACLPLLVSSPKRAILWIIVLNGVRSFMSNFGNPAWTALVADLVPRSMRTQYFANRNVMMGVVALLVVPLAGWLIRAGNGWMGQPLLGYQAAFLLAFASGLLATLCFQRIPEPHPLPRSRTHRRDAVGLREALRGSPEFAGLVISAFIWNMALQVAAPFFSVYLVERLHASVSTVGLLAGINVLFALIGTRMFGALMDKRGALWVQQTTGFLIPILPFSWMLVTAPWQTSFMEALGGLLWAGYNLANFNLLLELTPDERRAEAVALYQTVVFVSAVLGPLLGGYLADTVGFRAIFGLSGAGRILGMVAFVWLAAGPALRRGKGLPAQSL